LAPQHCSFFPLKEEYTVYKPSGEQALLDYLTGEKQECCPAQIDKDFTAEREVELAAVLKKVRQTEETSVSWLDQLKLEGEIKQEEEGNVEEGAVKDENVNGRSVFAQLKELLLESWRMSDSQVMKKIVPYRYTSPQCCGSGIRCIFTPRIRDPGLIFFPDPGSFRRPNFNISSRFYI
jgi:hypothetical protein